MIEEMKSTEKIKRWSLIIHQMTCAGCEEKIEQALEQMLGVLSIKASFVKGIVEVKLDTSVIDVSDIVEIINELGYRANIDDGINENISSKPRPRDLLRSFAIFGTIALVIILVFLIANFGIEDFNPLDLTSEAGLVAVFLYGLITSLHCVGMCGGIQFSVCATYQSDHHNRRNKLKPTLLYNFGRIISYTLIGGLLGGIGSTVVVTVDTRMNFRIVIGILMLLMGVGMLTRLPLLQKLMPSMPKFVGRRLRRKIGNSSPFIVGLLTGFKPCGPMQTAQLYALGTASMLTGALTMFLFSVSTIPIMLGFGLVSVSLSQKFAGKMMVVGAIIIMFLGLILLI